jgi:membrane-associated HD superfamily phosphohydrolase
MGKRRGILYLALACLAVGVSYFSGERVQAASVEYSVVPEKSAKQVDQNQSYFDLKLAPGKKEVVTVAVHNNTNKAIVVETNVDRLTTNSNGVVEYTNSNQRQNVKLKYKINDLVKASTNQIKLAAKATQKVTYTVQQPAEKYDGVLAGGINFVKKNNDDAKQKSNMSVKNQYGYSIAIILHGNKDLAKHTVTAGKAEVKQSNKRNSVYVPIKNETAAFLNKVKVDGKVFRAGSDKVIYTNKMENAQVAPNSVYDFPISTNETALKPGKYTVKVNVESKGEKWQFTKYFEITRTQSVKLNKTAVLKKEDHTRAIISAIILVLVALILIILWFLRRKNREIEALKRKMK